MAQYVITNERTGVDWECETGTVQRILQNCRNLLITKMGEIPYDRYRGIDMRIIDKPLTEVRDMIEAECDRLMLYEKRAKVISASAYVRDHHDLVVRVIIDI